MSDAEQKERVHAVIDCLVGLPLAEAIELVSRVLAALRLQATEEI